MTAREQKVRCGTHLLLPLTLLSGPHWGVYEKTKVWNNALVNRKDQIEYCTGITGAQQQWHAHDSGPIQGDFY